MANTRYTEPHIICSDCEGVGVRKGWFKTAECFPCGGRGLFPAPGDDAVTCLGCGGSGMKGKKGQCPPCDGKGLMAPTPLQQERVWVSNRGWFVRSTTTRVEYPPNVYYTRFEVNRPFDDDEMERIAAAVNDRWMAIISFGDINGVERDSAQSFLAPLAANLGDAETKNLYEFENGLDQSLRATLGDDSISVNIYYNEPF